MRIGCDISKIVRFNDWNDSILTKYFTLSEIEYLDSKPLQGIPQTLAGVFSAKEAFLKAVGTGVGNGIAMKEIEILHDENGKPTIKYSGSNQSVLSLNFDVSISHDDGIAMAVVIAWTRE